MERRPENQQGQMNETVAPEKKGINTVMIVLSVIAALLAVALIFIAVSKSKLVKELNQEKEELTEQIVTLQQDYATLSSDYESINSQLDSSREEVNQLVERIKKADATNRAQIRKYQKELGTLRSIMRNYIVQIDSLNTLNHKLTADAAAARKEAAVAKQQNEELQKTVSDLSDKVETGAIIRGRDIRSEAVNNSGKAVDRAGSAVRVGTTVTLVENGLADRGPVRVFVIVKDPEGNVMKNADSINCNYAGGTLETSASREVDYAGNDLDVTVFLNDVKFVKGVYSVQVLTETAFLGSTQFILR